MKKLAIVFALLTTSAHAETGIASHYGHGDGQTTALACPHMGRLKTLSALTAAHKSLPCGTKVLVTNLRNHRSITVTINDRGPYVRGRIIDLTYYGATKLGMDGIAPVEVSVLR